MVRLYVEALSGGGFDESLVPEIETAFAEVGRLVGVDFEEMRRAMAKKKKGGRPKNVPRSDALLMDWPL